MFALIMLGDGREKLTQIGTRTPCTDFRTGKMYSRTRLISHRPEALATKLVCKFCVTYCSSKFL